MRDSSGVAVRLVGTMQEIPAAVVTERRMRRQQGALLALVVERTRRQPVTRRRAGADHDGGGHHPRRGAHQRLVVHGRPLETRLPESVPKKPRASDGRPGCSTSVRSLRTSRALEQNRALDASDAQNDPRTRELTAGYLVPLGITSMLEATVRMDTGALVGVVCHEHVGPIRQWMLDERSFAASIADMVTSALTADRRRRLTAALAHSEERYRTYVSISTEAILGARVRSADQDRSAAGAAGGRGDGARGHRRM